VAHDRHDDKVEPISNNSQTGAVVTISIPLLKHHVGSRLQ